MNQLIFLKDLILFVRSKQTTNYILSVYSDTATRSLHERLKEIPAKGINMSLSCAFVFV